MVEEIKRSPGWLGKRIVFIHTGGLYGLFPKAGEFAPLLERPPGPRAVGLFRAAYPLAPLSGRQALGIALFSYAGGLYWGFNADWERLPDLHDFALSIDTHFEQLAKAVEGRA